MFDVMVSNNGINADSKGKEIIFVSDLHFDFTKGKYKPKAALQMKDDFITFVKERYSNYLLCIAGDFFNRYEKTLDFVKEMEKNKINGFFVLGNHDFWNNGEKSHQDLINIFSSETQDNQYFKFLSTGKKYYWHDICVIGDTGWTSFRRRKRRVNLKQFMELPDATKVRDFNPTNIIELHEKWVNFANTVLKQEEKVLIITHFPMVDFTQEDKDCWWSSTTELKGDNSWRIFGHTHHMKEQQNNNVSFQRGYDNRDIEDLRFMGLKQYSSYSFGKLEKAEENKNLTVKPNFESISTHYSPAMVEDEGSELELVSTIKRRGYKRCSANSYNFAVLANDMDSYLERVQRVISGYLKDTYIGYILSGRISKRTVDAIYNSIIILEGKDFSDVRAFITAAVITGYVFNGMPFLIDSMRPLDNYDIMRFWLMFLTIKQYGIDVDSIGSVRSDKSQSISFGNVQLFLPEVNGLSLEVSDVEALIQQTPLLSQPAVFL
ncbi:hypothetical protein FRZ06_11465 [Anoxybacterium hadale]|uniref:Uncharacterized protein n=1 Tax=Anoxybacterium hadale TaxID=3408580 RepID=A0ACD1ABQ5_9FIRM|nr:hypothetical protein FRZ06_11465 [Clostridiales bacterium]